MIREVCLRVHLKAEFLLMPRLLWKWKNEKWKRKKKAKGEKCKVKRTF